jgi:hypothetical protein
MTDQQRPSRPVIMESLTASQLEELELQVDEDDREEFTTIATSYGWDKGLADQVWDWLATGERRQGLEE